ERNVYLQAELLASRGTFARVATVFLDQDPSMADLLQLVPERVVTVVPLFVADGWHVGQSIPAELELDGPETRRGGRVVRYAGPVGTHPEVADVILALAAE